MSKIALCILILSTLFSFSLIAEVTYYRCETGLEQGKAKGMVKLDTDNGILVHTFEEVRKSNDGTKTYSVDSEVSGLFSVTLKTNAKHEFSHEVIYQVMTADHVFSLHVLSPDYNRPTVNELSLTVKDFASSTKESFTCPLKIVTE
jgi:hypothetical protein